MRGCGRKQQRRWEPVPLIYRNVHQGRRIQSAVMRYILALFALAGVAVSWMALRVHYSTETQPCSINEKWDCGIVNHSPYAEVAHVPVAAIGIAGYVVIAILALVRRRRLLAGATVIGLAFSLYLTHIEKDVLLVWCLYCVISLGVISAITLLSLLWAFMGRSPRAH